MKKTVVTIKSCTGHHTRLFHVYKQHIPGWSGRLAPPLSLESTIDESQFVNPIDAEKAELSNHRFFVGCQVVQIIEEIQHMVQPNCSSMFVFRLDVDSRCLPPTGPELQKLNEISSKRQELNSRLETGYEFPRIDSTEKNIFNNDDLVYCPFCSNKVDQHGILVYERRPNYHTETHTAAFRLFPRVACFQCHFHFLASVGEAPLFTSSSHSSFAPAMTRNRTSTSSSISSLVSSAFNDETSVIASQPPSPCPSDSTLFGFNNDIPGILDCWFSTSSLEFQSAYRYNLIMKFSHSIRKKPRMNEIPNMLTISFGVCGHKDCHRPSRFKCGRCSNVLYCDPECQRRDWPVHRLHCI